MMNDRTMEVPDRLTAAARAELDAIQRRLDDTGDVEAGLREILLEEHYHRFVEEQAGRFDVGAGLAEILVSDMEDTGPYLVVVPTDAGLVHYPGSDEIHLLCARFTFDCESAPEPNTLDRVRQVATEMFEAIMEIEEVECIDTATAAYNMAMAGAQRHAEKLRDLADALDGRLISKEDALTVVCGAMDTFMHLYGILDDPDDHSVDDCGSLKGQVFRLGVEASRLQQPIRRLFDPSDDTVGSLH